jgi:PAS domain S-box-containing protein
MIQKIARHANIKPKLFQQNEAVLRQPNLVDPHKPDSTFKDIIICCLPLPPHVPFFISGDIAKVLGYEPEDIIGNTNFWINTVHMADIPQLFTGFYHMFIRGSHVYDYRFLSKDGTYKPMFVQIFLHRQQKDKPATVMACLRESITDTWDTPPGGNGGDAGKNSFIEMTIDSKNLIRFIDPQVEELLGYSPKKMIGKSPLDFVPPDYILTTSDAFTKIVNQKHNFIRFWNAVVHKDGSLRFLMHDCTGHFDDKKERIIKVRCRNITDQVALDETKRLRCERQLLSTLSRGESIEHENVGAHPLEKLSGREREILYLTVEGFSSTRIGERLYISSRTVEAHRANLMRKLNANSINQLVRYMVFHIYTADYQKMR